MKFDAPPPPSFRTVVWVVSFVALVSALGGTYAYYRDKRQDEAWLVFRASHDCRAVAHTPSWTSISRSPSTKGPDVLTPMTHKARTSWLCDDQKTYLKDDE